MQRNHNKLIHQHAPKISLPRETRRTLAQLRTNKTPILISYLHKVDETHHPSPLCPLCKTHPHTTTTFSTAHTYIPQAIYWTSGCLPREWRPCWSSGRYAWKGFSRETGLSDPSTATRRRGRSTTTTEHCSILSINPVKGWPLSFRIMFQRKPSTKKMFYIDVPACYLWFVIFSMWSCKWNRRICCI